MTQSHTQNPAQWCAALQAKMMAALDAAWDLAERSDDPAVLIKARDKARLCGQIAAAARRIAALVPAPKGKPEAFEPVRAQVAALEAAVEVTGALDPGAAPGKPAAAQAVAMRAALRKLGRG